MDWGLDDWSRLDLPVDKLDESYDEHFGSSIGSVFEHFDFSGPNVVLVILVVILFIVLALLALKFTNKPYWSITTREPQKLGINTTDTTPNK
jgi:hypothetical protein